MDGGEYADESPSKLLRSLALAVVVLGAFLIHESSGLRWCVRYILMSFLALACIWFPSAMTRFRWSDNFPPESAHPLFLVIAAWIFIVLVPLIWVALAHYA
ncbi:MAG: hypothetical protein RLZZ505_2522 [Verrucomicrobiota bacterium]|jgi:hypothetical protein